MNAFLHVAVVLVIDYVWNSDVFIIIAQIRVYFVLITLSGWPFHISVGAL